MKTDIIIAGVGGQGILSIAAVIGTASLQQNLFFKQSEVHGMSQRGGAVESHFRVSDKPIASDLIPQGKADIIISVEPMESLRYLPFLAKDGWVITNTRPFINIDNYPELTELLKTLQLLPHHIALDADTIAEEIKSSKSSNMVMMGAASPFIDIPAENFENAITEIFKNKGADVVDINIKAFRMGRDFALQNR